MAEHLELAAERRELAERATMGEWREVALGEVATVRSGFAFKSSDWTNEGIPVVKIANVKKGSLALDSCSYVSDETAAKAEEFILEEGDILIAMTGYIGDVAVVRSDDLPAVLNQRVGRFSVRDPSELLQDFLFYLLRSDDVRKEIEGLGYGSAQPNISPTLIHSVEFSLPPLPEQRAIAHVLGTLDDKIEMNRRMSQTLEEMARALFKSWFVDFDPVRAKAAPKQHTLGSYAGLDCELSETGTATAGEWTVERARAYLDAMAPHIADLFPDRLVPSELGEIPEGWEVKALGEIVELAYGKALRAGDRKDGIVPVYGSNGQVGWHDERLAAGPGIVVGRKGNPGVVTWSHGDFFPIDTTFYVIPRNANFGLHFLFFALASQDLPSVAADSAVPGLNRNLAYMNMQLLPNIPLMAEFNDYARDIFSRRHRLQSESRCLAAQRDALLPELMSGIR